LCKWIFDVIKPLSHPLMYKVQPQLKTTHIARPKSYIR